MGYFMDVCFRLGDKGRDLEEERLWERKPTKSETDWERDRKSVFKEQQRLEEGREGWDQKKIADGEMLHKSAVRYNHRQVGCWFLGDVR